MSDILLRLTGPKIFDVILEEKGPVIGETYSIIGIIRYGSDKRWWFYPNGAIGYKKAEQAGHILRVLNDR